MNLKCLSHGLLAEKKAMISLVMYLSSICITIQLLVFKPSEVKNITQLPIAGMTGVL